MKTGSCEQERCVQNAAGRGLEAGGRPGTGVAGAAVLACLCLVCGGREARAADTVETWAIGATDVDFYLGYEGLGAAREARRVFGDIMLGYGIVERFSAFLGATLEGDGTLNGGGGTVYLGAFGTPVDTSWMDLDLMLALETPTAGGALAVVPGVELNYDADPEMRSWGTFLRLTVPVHGGEEIEGHPRSTHFCATATLGGYYRLTHADQAVVEVDAAWQPYEPAESRWAWGLVKTGYNRVLSDSLELITHVYVQPPVGGQVMSTGFMTGFIASLPSARSSR